MKQIKNTPYSILASSFDTPPTVALRTSGSESTPKSKKYILFFPLALSVFASKTYRRVAFLLLAISPLCHAKDTITFQAIESYINKPQPHSHVDYLSFEALCKHANGLFSLEHYEEAIAFYKQALALNPTSAQIFFNLGQALYYAKKYPEALYAYKRAIQYKKDHHRAFMQIAKIMIDVKQPNDAIDPLKRSLFIEPKNGDARILLARLYNDKHFFNQSIDIITEGLELEPDHINLRFELGNTYNLVNRLDESLAIYQYLDRLIPNNPSILYNIGFTFKKMGLLAESLPYYNRTLELNPDHSEAIFSRGLAYLVIGDFEKGWHGYEWRYSRPSQGSLRSYDAPRWDGSDLHGKTILIHAEQGLGDTFQFIRYAKLVKEKNGIVIAAVQKPLITIMKLCKYIDQVISVDETPPHFDVHSPIMSLPYALKTTLDTIPDEIPYLYANEKLVTDWKQKLAADKNFKIGICWQGNDNYATPLLRATVAQKSIHPKQYAPICEVPGVSVYSLQKTTGTDQLNDLPSHIKIITFEGDFDQSNGRFMDTAAVIKNLDLVITVDTSISHLASALGTPTWVMLPNPADWRWMLNRTDSPWYPKVLRLFKQPTPGDWETMILEVAEELTLLRQGYEGQEKHIAQKVK
ncbi:MAG TPA: tetratricopeptide repeat protein [Candidatus Babeliales bacterium]|nr:tetratricopeptide repeat protein [Candidatus Babeliales bacterium]